MKTNPPPNLSLKLLLNINPVDFPPQYSQWRQSLKNELNQPPLKARQALYLGACLVGSIEANLAQRLVEAGLLSVCNEGVRVDAADMAQANKAFARLAHWLHEQGMAAPWRDELLPVCNEGGDVCAHVERAVVRVLGVTTQVVYLIGVDARGSIWLQRRAANKATNPNLLDVLVGGLVSQHENLQEALAREAQEEAGLYLQQLPPPIYGGGSFVRRPIDPELEGYMVEQGHWSILQLPKGVTPTNQDGEVSEFVLLEPAELLLEMLAGLVTQEACLILSEYFATLSI